MKLKFLNTIFATLLLASCSDTIDLPGGDGDNDAKLTIGFMTDNYGEGISRANTDPDDGHRCWEDFNENLVTKLDFYLIGNDGKISFYKELPNLTGEEYISNDCNTPHTILEFKDDGFSNVADLTFDVLNGSSAIIMVANFPLTLTSDQRIGRTFEDLYANRLVEFTENQHKEMQASIPMVGRFDLPTQISKYSNITIPLRRTIAKIRLRVMNMSATDQSMAFVAASDFQSILCRYSNTGRIIPDEQMPNFADADKRANPNNIWPAAFLTNLSGPYAGTTWSYPNDITEAHPENMVKSNGHVYYTCPSDWVDYTRFSQGCTRQKEHAEKYASDNTVGHPADAERYSITNADDSAPIIDTREMFLIIKAPYTKKVVTYEEREVEVPVVPEEGEEGEGGEGGEGGGTTTTTEIVEVVTYETNTYFYRVPINYRISSINDQQCFSRSDLINKVFNLYRAERNCFYDITVMVDREGAASPEQAVDPRFTLNVMTLADGGTYDYIYE